MLNQVVSTSLTRPGRRRQTLDGREAIAGLPGGRGDVRERPKIFHLTTNVIIEPAPAGVTGSAYVILIDLAAEDVIVKTSEGWRFKKHSYFAAAGDAAGDGAAV